MRAFKIVLAFMVGLGAGYTLLDHVLDACTYSAPTKADYNQGNLDVVYVMIDGRRYLAQWQSNGHQYRWVIVAGPITSLQIAK